MDGAKQRNKGVQKPLWFILEARHISSIRSRIGKKLQTPNSDLSLTVRIGLIRHFEVKKPLPSGWMTAAQLIQWREDYEAAEVTVGTVDLGGLSWTHCWSSDASRACVTARTAFSGTITQWPELREAEVPPFATGNLRLPVWCWRVLLRLSWYFGHRSQRPARDAFLQRVRLMADKLVAQKEDTLVFCHAGVMHFLRKELLRRGFTGPRFTLAHHARLYVFEKTT